MKKKKLRARLKPLQVAVWSVYGRAEVGLSAQWEFYYEERR